MSGGPHPSARLPETGRQGSADCPCRGSAGAAPRVRTGMRAERRCDDALCVCVRARCRRRRLAQWDARLVQLARFRRRFGHSAVPHDWKENPDLHRCRPVSVGCACSRRAEIEGAVRPGGREDGAGHGIGALCAGGGGGRGVGGAQKEIARRFVDFFVVLLNSGTRTPGCRLREPRRACRGAVADPDLPRQTLFWLCWRALMQLLFAV